MTDNGIKDTNIENYGPKLITPNELLREFPLSDKAQETVINGRAEIKKILSGESMRKLLIVGPCAIHNFEEAIEYAEKLKTLSEKVQDKYHIVMRTYFEKPRTTIGWEGFLKDPNLDESFDMNKGYRRSRELLLKINEMGLPAATEFLDPDTPQYIGDLISWAAIGARTTESPTHKEMASGLSCTVGFKNATSGNVNAGINAMESARYPHHFAGKDMDGVARYSKY